MAMTPEQIEHDRQEIQDKLRTEIIAEAIKHSIGITDYDGDINLMEVEDFLRKIKNRGPDFFDDEHINHVIEQIRKRSPHARYPGEPRTSYVEPTENADIIAHGIKQGFKELAECLNHRIDDFGYRYLAASDNQGNVTTADTIISLSLSIDNFAEVYAHVHGYKHKYREGCKKIKPEKAPVETVTPEQLRAEAQRARKNGK